MNVKEIVTEYLKTNGYDGLWLVSPGCACKLDDLMPCEGDGANCKPGYLLPCNCGEGCDFHIGLKQEANDGD